MTHVNVAFMKSGEYVCSIVPVEVPDDLSVQESADLPQDCGMFKILTAEDGDKRVVWNRLILKEIRAAKKMFLDLVNKGLVPYKVSTTGNPTSEIMREFDPSAEEIIFLPVAAAVGG